MEGGTAAVEEDDGGDGRVLGVGFGEPLVEAGRERIITTFGCFFLCVFRGGVRLSSSSSISISSTSRRLEYIVLEKSQVVNSLF